MKKKTVIITGGAQGIGKATAKAFKTKGYNVVIADIDAQAGNEAVKEMKGVRFIKADVSSETAVKKLIAAAARAYGRIDVLMNNTGIGINKPVTELKLSEWNKVIAVNLTSAMLCVKHAAPFLKKTKGCVINTASTRAFMSEKNTESYSASKGGIVALTHALAVSLGPDIRVNCISPGWIEVSDWKKKADYKKPVHSAADKMQHPAGRVGVPGDIAELSLYLASDKAGFITGQNFTVDGGMTKKMIYV